MRTILFAMVLTVIQAAPPVPRKAPDTRSGSSQSVRKDSGDKQAPAAPLTVPDTVSPRKDEHAGEAPPNITEPNYVVIRELPPVSVTRGWIDDVSLFFTAILMIAGGLGVWAAFRTLGVIEKQTNAMERSVRYIQDQAITMKRQTFILQNSVRVANKSAELNERSLALQKIAMEQWIDTEDWNASGSSYLPPMATEDWLSLNFNVINNTKFKLTLQTVNLWIDGEPLEPKEYGEEVLAPEQYYIVETGFRLVGTKLIAYRDRDLEFEIGGRIRFKDAFNDQRDYFFGLRCACRQRGQARFEPMFFRPPKGDEGQKNSGQNPN